MAIVAILGVLRVDLNATVLAVLLILEITAVALFDLGAFMHPADGTITLAGLRLGDLFGGTGFENIGIVIAFGVAAFTGFESAAIYSEECKDPRHTVGRATFAAVTFISLFYALSAWALTIGTGPSMVAEQSRQNGPGVVFGLFGQYWGNLVADVANVLFFTSVYAALLSFHNGGRATCSRSAGNECCRPSWTHRRWLCALWPVVAADAAGDHRGWRVVIGAVTR